MLDIAVRFPAATALAAGRVVLKARGELAGIAVLACRMVAFSKG